MKHAAFLALIFCACSGAKLFVPATFKENATALHVKGINGWQVNQQISFGDYQTSRIKRGWDFTSSVQYTKFGINPETVLLSVFDVHTDNRTNNKRSSFQYVIGNHIHAAEVYATEKFKETQLVYKSNNPYIGSASSDLRYEYAFTAAIVPLTAADKSPWSLVLINRYERARDTARKLFDRPYVEEEGYATNGKISYAIRPLRANKVAGENGSEKKIVGGKLLAGYEIQKDGKSIAMIDILDNNIYLLNDIDASEKLVLSAVSSAILLKRMQDIDREKDDPAS